MPVTGETAVKGAAYPGQSRPPKADRYLHASGLVKAMELRLLDQARLNRLQEAAQPDEISRILGECGYPAGRNPEEILAAELTATLDWLVQVMPDPGYAATLITFHDGHNLKLVLKKLLTLWITEAGTEQPNGQPPAINGREAAEAASLPEFGGLNGIPPFGRMAAQALRPAQVDPDFLYHEIAEHRSGNLPDWLFSAAVSAVKRYMAHYDLSVVDTWLDRVTWQRSHQLAAQTGNQFLIGWLRLKTDLINLELLLRARALRIGPETLKNTLLPNDSIPANQVLDLYGATEETIVAAYAKTPYAALAELCRTYKKQGQAARFGLLSDNLLMRHIRSASRIVSGPEVPLAWALARQAEIKNVRIILTCLRNAVPKAQVRELIRDNYLAWR